MACELPATTGRPLPRWSAAELAREAVARGIVCAVSGTTVWIYARRWQGPLLHPRDCLISADEKTQLPALLRLHPLVGQALGARDWSSTSTAGSVR